MKSIRAFLVASVFTMGLVMGCATSVDEGSLVEGNPVAVAPEVGNGEPLPSQFTTRTDALSLVDVPAFKDGGAALQSLFGWLSNVVSMLSNNGKYEFTPEELQQVALMGEGRPLKERWAMMHEELKRTHPGKVADELYWIFNSAGNVICQLALVYGSPKEYVAFFGTPIGATGFSGRYKQSDVWDIMVQGEMLTYTPGQFEPTRFVLGDTAFLAKGTAKGFSYVNSTWMIDYARGNTLSMFPFGLIAPTMNVTLDYQNAWDQIRIYAGLVFKSLF